MTRAKLISAFFIGLLIFVIYQVVLIFSPFFKVIFAAAILAFSFYPFYKKLKSLLKNHDNLAAILMTLFIFLAVIPPVLMVIMSLTTQVIQLYQSISDYVQTGELNRLVDSVQQSLVVQNLQSHVVQWELVKKNLSGLLLDSVKPMGNFMTAQAGIITKNILLFALGVVFTFCLVFVFLKDGERIYSFFYQTAPLEEKNKKSIFDQISGIFAAVIRGQLLTSFAQAIILGVVFWALNLPLPVFFAAVTFVASLIPIVGAASVWIPFTIYLFVSHHTSQAVILLLVGILVISFVDNLIKPAVIGEKAKLPYFLLFFGIIGGLKLYGFLGIFIAPVVLSLFFALVRIYREEYLSK